MYSNIVDSSCSTSGTHRVFSCYLLNSKYLNVSTSKLDNNFIVHENVPLRIHKINKGYDIGQLLSGRSQKNLENVWYEQS
jgi:hypothetical protein